MTNVSVVIPNWNGKEYIGKCIDSLLNQTLKPHIIVVENGSTDGSLNYLKEKYPKIEIVINPKNLGFAGGVNTGIEKSIDRSDDFVALFNNDAVADAHWVEELVGLMSANHKVGIATSKMLDTKGETIDDTGDMYTIWGLPYPRGRNEPSSQNYLKQDEVFGGSGGASIYRLAMLKDIGLFDEDFFAYYEDVDLSFRAQLAGWKVIYVPTAIVYHQIGATSKKIKGFTTYQTMKNLPWLALKNVPRRYIFRVYMRLKLALFFFWARAVLRHQGWAATKGVLVSLIKTPKKLKERRLIQKSKQVTDEYIWGIITHDLPPNTKAMRGLRNKWWRITRRKDANSN